MGLDCNVIPQTKVGDKLEDSQCFIDLWDRAKRLYPKDSIKARTKAKTDYEALKSTEFKTAYGDWQLLKAIRNNELNNAQIDAFSSIYGNNLDKLTNSIKIPLNRQNEPDMKSFSKMVDAKRSEILYDNAYPFIADSEQAYLNRIFAAITIRLEPQINDLTVKDFKNGIKVRGLIANVLRQYAKSTSLDTKSYGVLINERIAELKASYANKDVQTRVLEKAKSDIREGEDLKKAVNRIIVEEINNDAIKSDYTQKYNNLINLADEIDNLDNHHIWENFINYYRATFYGDISDFDIEDSLTMGEINGDGTAVTDESNLITKSWNDKLQFKSNRKDTVSLAFKRYLTQMIYNNQSNLFSNVNDTQLKGTAQYFNKYGLVMPFDIDVLWNNLIYATYDTSNRKQVVNNLKVLSSETYNGQLKPMIDQMEVLESDDAQVKEIKDNFYNTYMAAVNMAMTKVTYSETQKYAVNANDYELKYTVRDQNRASFAVTNLHNEYRNKLTNKFQYASDRNSVPSMDSIDLVVGSTDNLFADNIKKLILKSNAFGINWTLNTILNYVSTKFNTDFDLIKALYYDGNADSKVSRLMYSKIAAELTVVDNTFKDIVKQAKSAVTDKSSESAKTKQARRVKKLFQEGFKVDTDVSSIVDDMRGRIATLARVGACDPNLKIDLSYINVEGEQEYTPEFYNHITSMLQGIVNRIGEVNTDLMLIRFEDYITSASVQYNPLIWNTGDGKGFFNYQKNVDGSPMLDDNGHKILNPTSPVNIEGVKAFEYARFNGVENQDSGTGSSYVDMHDYVWTNDVILRQLQGRYSLPSADASRIYEFVTGNALTDKNAVGRSLSFRLFNSNGTFARYDIAARENLEDNFLYQRVKDTMKSEMANMLAARRLLFDYDSATRSLSIKKDYLVPKDEMYSRFANMDEDVRTAYINSHGGDYDAAFETYYENNAFDENLLDGLQSPIFWDGKSLLKNGKPTGTIFKFGNLNFRYTDSNGKVIVKDLTDYIEESYAESSDDSNLSFGGKPEPYMLCGEDANTAYGKIIDTAFMRMFVDRINSQLKEAMTYLEPIRSHIQSTVTYKNQLSREYETLPDEYKDDRHWAYVVGNMIANHYIADVAIQEIFTGFTFEFKNALDWAKRASQNVRTGSRTTSETEYTQIIIDDLKLSDNMLDLLAPINENASVDNIKKSDTIRKRFAGLINTADAFNIITQEECIKRFKAMGDYDSYTLPSGNTLKQLVENEDAVIDSLDYAKILQQLKYYFFKRGKSTLNNRFNTDFIFSHQDKNSTLVIFKRMYKGTKYETLYDWMKQEGIDSVNFASGHKVGGMPKVKLFDVSSDKKKATLNINLNSETNRLELKGYNEGVNAFKHTLKHSNLYTQQQIPSHLLNQENKIGTQLQKRILDNLDFGADYNIAGQLLKGITGDMSYDKAGVFERYQMLLSTNANDEMYRLLSDWGAIDDNGDIIYKTISTDSGDRNVIGVDLNLILADLRKYFNTSEIDRNFIKATIDVNGKPFIPFYHPTIKNRIESVLLARITKRITNLKLKGAHVTIQPDTFMQPAEITLDKKGFISGTQENVNRLYNDGQIRFSDDYWKDRAELNEDGSIKRDEQGNPIVRKDADFKLKSEYWEGNTFHPAEIILNNWDSRFKLDENGHLDLNTIPDNLRTMFGIRIPTEGHQSMFIAKVVGVLNNNASQAIVPEHLITRTGWDFDIDSIYLSMKEFEVVNGKYIEYKIESDDSVNAETIKRQSIDYVKDIYFAKENEVINQTYLDTKIPLVNELSDINIKINNELNKDNSTVNTLKEEYSVLQKQRFSSKNKSERELLSKALEAKAAEIESYNTASLDNIVTDKELKTLYDRKTQIYEELKKAKSKFDIDYNNFINTKVIPKWNKLNPYQRATRAAKDNAIIDTWIGIHSDKKTLLSKEKPNEFSHSADAASYVNTIAGYDNTSMNQHFLIDQIKIRNINNNIAVLKGQSIAADNALSIMGMTQTHLIDEFAIPIKIEFSNIEGYSEDIPNKHDWVKKKLLQCFKSELMSNKEQTIDISLTGNYATVWCRSLYNNDYGTWKDINDATISDQRSELTSHILDAVKENMGFNMNTYTIGNTALLASFPISWKVNLEHNGKSVTGVNRYIYSTLIESQQIISDFITDISIKSIENTNNFTNISFHNVRSNYIVDAIRTMASIMESNGKSFNEFVKEYIKDYKNHSNIKEVLTAIRNDLKTNTDVYASKRGISIKPNQVYAASKFLEYIAEQTNVTAYEFDSNIKNKAMTVTELDTLFKKGFEFKENIKDLTEYADYLNRQLEVLDYYMYVDKAVNAMKRAQGVLITEKKGAGPKTSESNKLFESIAMLEHNINTIKIDAKVVGIPETLIKKLDFAYYSVNDITEKNSIIDEWLAEANDYLMTYPDEDGNVKTLNKPKSPFAIGDKSMVEAIFPSIKNKDWKIEDSAYPILQQQLYSTNELSTRLFHDLFISENPVFTNKINYVMAQLNQVNNPELRENLINYAIIDKVREMPFFNDLNKEPIELSLERSKLLGCVTIEQTSDGPIYKGTVDLGLTEQSLKTWFNENTASNYTHEEKIAKFKELPVAIQLAMVKKTMIDGQSSVKDGNLTINGNMSLNPNHILSLLIPNTMMPSIIRRGYIGITCKESDDVDFTRDSFFQLINSPDEYCRILGENLVRYTFWINKFDFGRNLAKYIPIDLLGKFKTKEGETITSYKTSWGEQFDSINFESIDGSTDIEMRKYMREKGIINGGSTFRSTNTALYNYADSLYNSQTLDNNILLRSQEELDTFIEAFVRANSENTRLVKFMLPEYSFNNGKRSVREQTPSFIKVSKSQLSRTILGTKEPILAGQWSDKITDETKTYIQKAFDNVVLSKHKDVWDVLSQMIIEPTSYVENSKYANDLYLKTREKVIDSDLKDIKKSDKSYAPEGKLYKRFDVNGCTIYYPINRTFKSEYLTTCCDYFKYNIEPKEVYEKLGTILSKFYKESNPSVTNTESYPSVSSAIDATVKDSDTVLYIGDTNDINRGLINHSDVIDISKADIENGTLSMVNIPTNTQNLALISDSKPLSQLERLTIQGSVFKSLESLIQSINPTMITTIQTDGLSDIIVDYLGTKKNLKTTVNTINSTDAKFSVILDTEFVSDDNTGIGLNNLEYINTLYDIEKTAIGNTKLLREEMNIMGQLTPKLQELDDNAKKEILNLTKDIKLIGNYIDTFKYNKAILDEVKIMVSNLDTNFTTDDISKLWGKNRVKSRKQFVTNLNKLSSLIKSQLYIEELNPIDPATFTNASQALIDKVNQFNENIINLKDQYSELASIKQKVVDASKIYFGFLINQKGHNPAFNTKFKYIQDSLVKVGFNADEIETYRITEKDIQENIRSMMGNNLDLSKVIEYLDSAAQSGIPIIDTVLAQYEYHSINAEEFALTKDKQTFALFKKYNNFYTEKSNGKPDMNFSQSRSSLFKERFINEANAQLVTPFDTIKASRDYNLRRAAIYDDYMQKLKALQPELDSSDIVIYNKAIEKLKVIDKQLAEAKKKAGKGIYENKTIAFPAKFEGGKFNIEIDKVLADPTKYFKDMSENEAYYYAKLMERITTSKIRKKFGDVNGISIKIGKSENSTLPYNFKLCHSAYKDAKFKTLTHEEIDMIVEMQELYAELNDVAMPNTVKPANFFPTFISANTKDVLKQLVGWHDLQADDYKNTLAGETQYYLKATALNRPEVKGTIKYDFYDLNIIDNYDKLIIKANKIAKHRGYPKEIKTVADIIEYNNSISDEQFANIKDRMNFDPLNVTLNYINQLKRIKVNRDFEPELQLLQTILQMPDFQARKYGKKSKNVVNKILSIITHKSEIIQDKGADTRAYERFKAFYDAFEGKNRINNNLDQLLNGLHTTNSKSLMWLNLTAALKNIGTGHVNIVSEATGGEFTTRSSLLKAHSMYVKALPSIWASMGEYTTDNLDAALIKLAGNIFEDHTDAGVDTKTNIVSLSMAKWDNVMFAPNTLGEHYLQFATFLAAMQTHRVVRDTVMNFEQFSFSIREELFESMLSEDKLKDYKTYKEDQKSKYGSNIEFVDYVRNFINYKDNNISDSFKKEYLSKYKEAMKEARTKFENDYKPIYDSFELNEGRATIKEGEIITLEEFAKFLGKVKGVNHSLHGIYNTFDKSMLSGSMIGEVILQFRKWLRPNFIRYFGKRVGKVIYDERLESYRSGAYYDFAHLILENGIQAYKDVIENAKEDGENVDFLVKAKAIFNFIGGFIMFAKDINFRYNTLPESQKANIKRATFNLMTLIGLSLAAGLCYAAADDDDELDSNIAFAVLSYTIYGVQTELYETSPHGLYSFYKRTMESPIPFENTVNNVSSLLLYALVAPMVLDEDELVYDRGTYKGKTKLEMAIKKTIPLVNQGNKLFNLPKNNTYYMQQNPILQMIVEANKKD